MILAFRDFLQSAMDSWRTSAVKFPGWACVPGWSCFGKRTASLGVAPGCIQFFDSMKGVTGMPASQIECLSQLPLPRLSVFAMGLVVHENIDHVGIETKC